MMQRELFLMDENTVHGLQSTLDGLLCVSTEMILVNPKSRIPHKQ